MPKTLTFLSDEITISICDLSDQLALVSLADSDGQPFIAESTTSAGEVTPSPSATQNVLNFPPQAISLEEFAGYLTFEVSQKEFFVQKTSATDILEQVTQSVADQAEKNARIANPVVTQACIAKSKDDGLWYRAQITSLSADNAVVMFVDFGNSTDVILSDILEIDESLVKTPAIALPCRLAAESADHNLTQWADGR